MASTPAQAAPPASGNAKCPACNAENVRLKNVDGMMICDKCASKKFSSKVRKSIQDAFEKAQDKARRDAYARRLQITKQAQDLCAKGKIMEAVAMYEKYLEVLETRFKTSKEGIHPHLFDQTTDDQELLLLTAVFWELAKIYDRKDDGYSYFKFYLGKYVEFSIGAPYMVLSAETLRKYVASGKAKHRKEMEAAQIGIRDKMKKCFISSAVYGPTSQETVILQEFRDEFLMRYALGRLLVDLYYALSPSIAYHVGGKIRFRRAMKRGLDTIVLPMAKSLLSKLS